MKFSEKLIRLRKIKGLTQDELASAVGVSRQAVYKWESGQSYPEVVKLIELKKLFEISIDDLLDEGYEIDLPEKKKRKRSVKPAEKTETEAISTVKAEPEISHAPESLESIDEKNSTVGEIEVAEPVEKIETPEEPKVEETSEIKVEKKEEESAVKVEKPAEEKKIGFFGRIFCRR